MFVCLNTPRFRVDRVRHQQVLLQFPRTGATGDPAQQAAMLSEDVVVYSDGGGKVPSALRPVAGADRAARLLAGLSRKGAAGASNSRISNGEPGVVLLAGATPVSVVTNRDRSGGTDPRNLSGQQSGETGGGARYLQSSVSRLTKGSMDLAESYGDNCLRMNFVDYYEMLQISPNAQMDTINRVYRMLAQRFHPDNPESGDLDRFVKLQNAHAVLSSPDKKAEYDEDRRQYYERPMEVFGMKEFSDGIEGEGNRRMGILCLLYNKRRSSPEEAGMSLLQMETLMAFPREHLLFTIWYLRQKQFVEFNFNSEYEITAPGIDLVESKFPKSSVLQRLIAAPTGSKLRPAAVVLENLRKTTA